MALPRKMTREESIKASKHGAIAAFISCGITLLLTIYAQMSGKSEGVVGMFNDPLIILDVIVAFICALGLLRYSRTAAITVLFWFLLGKTVIYVEFGKLPNLLSLVFIYFYWNAVLGTISYHKIEKEENPEYKHSPKWMYYIGIPSLIGTFALLILGLLTMTDFMPSMEVTAGAKFSKENRALLVKSRLVLPDEPIEYYYSGGFTSILEKGNILTDRRVIRYFEDEDKKLQIYELFFGDIVDVKKNEDGDFITDSLYTVTSGNGSWLMLELSTEGGGDVKFIEALKNKIMSTNNARNQSQGNLKSEGDGPIK